jgi:hypothetical protein
MKELLQGLDEVVRNVRRGEGSFEHKSRLQV